MLKVKKEQQKKLRNKKTNKIAKSIVKKSKNKKVKSRKKILKDCILKKTKIKSKKITKSNIVGRKKIGRPSNILLKEDKYVVDVDDPVEAIKIAAIVAKSVKAITNFEVGVVKKPLVGTPKEVQKELDKLALRLQKHPTDEDSFNKIHCYIHKFLLGLVFKKYNFVKGHDESDMYQESLVALFKKAIPKFNPHKGMSFLNFAKMCINRHLITILHASKHRKKDIPMNTAISIDHAPAENNDDNMSPLSNVIADDNPKTIPYRKIVDKETFACTLKTIKDELSDFEAVVLDEYLNEKSYKEVARSVSKKLSEKFNAKSVDNALLRIRKKAEELLLDGGEKDLPLFF